MGLRILVVEDDLVMQRLLTTILSRQGMECTVVRDGKSAIEAWERNRFDFVFMDVQMPVMNGLEATRIIREKEKARGGRTVIIATTAFASDSDRDMCLEAGMDDVMTKPLVLQELFTLIEEHQRKRHHEGR